jgi:catechol 2,3-dioxygenase-like lactoylglutathione lyase family enzyme
MEVNLRVLGQLDRRLRLVSGPHELTRAPARHALELGLDDQVGVSDVHVGFLLPPQSVNERRSMSLEWGTPAAATLVGVPRWIGINHVAVEVGSIDDALAFFGRIFDEVLLRGRGGHMAFIDLGDQFVALEAGRTRPPDGGRHIGLVVVDREVTLQRAREVGATMVGRNDFLDPWGNRWQVVDYRDVQFTKAPRVLEGMDLAGLEKSERALTELRDKGLVD